MTKNNAYTTGLCKKCQGLIFTMILFGPCKECKTGGQHPSWKRCRDCAVQENKCANCDKPLSKKKGKVYATGARSPRPKHGMGAVCPPDRLWTLGLTIASIKFVDDAEAALTEFRVLAVMEPEGSVSFSEIPKLRAAIERVKSMEVVLTTPLKVNEFLKTGEFPK